MENKLLWIVGAGGHGRAIAELARLVGWSDIRFIDDRYGEVDKIDGHPLLGNTSQLSDLVQPGHAAFVAIGNQQVRIKYIDALSRLSAEVITLIHPAAWVSSLAQLGPGSAVMAGSVVGTHARIGKGVIINANATVDHDASVEDYAHLGVGVQLAGGVVVGSCAWLQAGSCAGYNVVVPENAVIIPGTPLHA